MAKAPAFQLYVNDALRDTRVLSLEARGGWWDCLLMMWNAPERGVLDFTMEQFARLFGTDLGTAERVVSEIESTGVADVVRSCNGDVTRFRVINRRMFREAEARIKTRLRVQKHRSNAGVTPDVTPAKRSSNADVTVPSSSSSSSSCTKPPPAREAMESSRMEQQILTLLSFFDIRTGIATVGKSALDAFLAQPQFLEDDALEVIRERAGPWLAQDWIRDVNPRFIAERLPEIYNYQPKNNHGTHQASSRSRSSGTVGTCNEGKSSQYRGIKFH